MECVGCGSYGEVSDDCPLQCSDRDLVVWEQLKLMFVLGNSTWCHSEMLWQSYSHVWTFRWWLVVGGASKHSCSKDRSLVSPKGYRNGRRLNKSTGTGEVRVKWSNILNRV